MNTHQAMVKEFHQRFGQAAPDKRHSLTKEEMELRVRLINEEAFEFQAACGADDEVEMVDAICDLLYVTYGAAVSMGLDIDPFFAEVHKTNMAKAGGSKDADGKIRKPPGWVPPRIAELLERAP